MTVGIKRRRRPIGHPARGGQRHANAKGDRRHPLDVDSDQFSGHAVLHRGAQAVSEFCPVKDNVQGGEKDQAQDKTKDIDIGKIKAANLERRVHVPRVQLHIVGAEQDSEHAFDDQRDRKRDEDRQHGPIAFERPDQNHFRREAQDEHRGNRDDEAQKGVQVKILGESEAEISSENDESALGDVDNLHHAKDQRQARSHQRIDAPGQ